MSDVVKANVAQGDSSVKGPHVAYLVRRETHSSRAIAAVVMALIVLVVAVYLAAEGITQMSGHKALLISPSQMFFQLVEGPHAVPWAWIVAGAVIALFGLVFFVKAIAPGALGRHSIPDQRIAYVVDDSVIAAALSRAVRLRASVPAGQVSTSVDRRQIAVTVRPTSGQDLDEADLQTFAADQVHSYNLHPNPSVKVHITSEGVVAK